MNKALGYVVIAIAIIYLLVSVGDFWPKYSKVPYLVEHQEELGLVTSTTNLRFHMMWEMIVDVIVGGLLILLGWWLTTTETQQYSYFIVLGLVFVALTIIWSIPLIPLHIARISPQGAFYNAQVEFEVNADTTRHWVIIPAHKDQRVALSEVYKDRKLIGKKELVLEFRGNKSALDAYLRASPPVAILGRMKGTRNLAVDKWIYTVSAVEVLKVGTAE